MSQITLGSMITFLHGATTRVGTVFGAELVEGDRRRRSGQHLFIRADNEVIDVHSDQIGGLVGDSAFDDREALHVVSDRQQL